MPASRTTVRLPGDLLRQAKLRAAESGRTLTGMITDALRREVSGSQVRRKAKLLAFHTFKGTGVFPGIDLNDTSSLLDVMDGIPAHPRR